MSRTSVALTKQWSGPQPQLGWIFSLGETPGKALNIIYKNARSVTGAIDMPAELRTGAGNKAPNYASAPNRNPTPTALSLKVNQDMYLGFVLDPKLGAIFADAPFSGGYSGSDGDYFSVTRVTDTTAYLIIKGSSFGAGDYSKPFNIHLVATGTQGNNVAYATPLIIDPDTRWPAGWGPP